MSQRVLAVRYNSGGSSLLDIFKRIESITNKVQLAGEAPTPKQQQARPQQKKAAPRTQNQRIGVANHPLMNRFGQNNFRAGNRPRQNNKPRNPDQQASTALTRKSAAPKPESTAATRPRTAQTSTQGRPQAAQANRAPAAKSSTPRQQTTKRSTQSVGSVPSKKLPEAAPLKVSVNGDTFLYGKVTSINPCVSLRVASITKEALVLSKYPYMLPKHIIDQAPDTADNQFLLQKNYSLDVDADQIQTRFSEVVQGKMEDIQFDKKLGTHAETTKAEINKNGSLNVADRQLLFDAVNGVRPFKDILANACWVKK